MKYKKRYNFILIFILVVIVVSITCKCALDFDHVESQEDKEIMEVIQQEQNTEVAESSVMKKVEFNKFGTAFAYASNYLKTCKGYKSYMTGCLNMQIANIIDIKQYVNVYSTVNNKTKSAHSFVTTDGTGKIRATIGWEYVKIGNQVSFREGDHDGEKFIYDNEEVTRMTNSEFVDEWGCMAEEVFVDIYSHSVQNGSIRKVGSEYVLTFVIEDGILVRDTTKFVKRVFDNSEYAMLVNPSFDSAKIEMMLDAYGRPKKINYYIGYHDLDFTEIGFPIKDARGSVTYTQHFYQLNQAENIAPMPDKVSDAE